MPVDLDDVKHDLRMWDQDRLPSGPVIEHIPDLVAEIEEWRVAFDTLGRFAFHLEMRSAAIEDQRKSQNTLMLACAIRMALERVTEGWKCTESCCTPLALAHA